MVTIKLGSGQKQLTQEITIIEPEPEPITEFYDPTADFEFLVDINNVSFTNLSQYDENLTDGGLQYEWDFGDGSEGTTEADPTHEYAEVGEYEVILKVTDTNGSSAQVTKTVMIEEVPAPVTDPPETDPNDENGSGENGDDTPAGGNSENGGDPNDEPTTEPPANNDPVDSGGGFKPTLFLIALLILLVFGGGGLLFFRKIQHPELTFGDIIAEEIARLTRKRSKPNSPTANENSSAASATVAAANTETASGSDESTASEQLNNSNEIVVEGEASNSAPAAELETQEGAAPEWLSPPPTTPEPAPVAPPEAKPEEIESAPGQTTAAPDQPQPGVNDEQNPSDAGSPFVNAAATDISSETKPAPVPTTAAATEKPTNRQNAANSPFAEASGAPTTEPANTVGAAATNTQPAAENLTTDTTEQNVAPKESAEVRMPEQKPTTAVAQSQQAVAPLPVAEQSAAPEAVNAEEKSVNTQQPDPKQQIDRQTQKTPEQNANQQAQNSASTSPQQPTASQTESEMNKASIEETQSKPAEQAQAASPSQATEQTNEQSITTRQAGAENQNTQAAPQQLLNQRNQGSDLKPPNDTSAQNPAPQHTTTPPATTANNTETAPESATNTHPAITLVKEAAEDAVEQGPLAGEADLATKVVPPVQKIEQSAPQATKNGTSSLAGEAEIPQNNNKPRAE